VAALHASTAPHFNPFCFSAYSQILNQTCYYTGLTDFEEVACAIVCCYIAGQSAQVAPGHDRAYSRGDSNEQYNIIRPRIIHEAESCIFWTDRRVRWIAQIISDSLS